jgi:hypothetical protein
LKKLRIDFFGIRFELLKYYDMAPVTTDDVEEVADVLPEPPSFVIVELSGVEAGAGHLSALTALSY